MMNPSSGLVALSEWLDQLRQMKFNEVRNIESFHDAYLENGRKKKRLRGVLVAPDLCLGRDRVFYKIMEDQRAIVMPVVLVAEQYEVKDLINAYARAKRERHTQRKRQRRAS